MAAVRVGIQLQQQHTTYRKIRRAWQAVDGSGAETRFNGDRFFPLAGDPDGAHLDHWTGLGAMAEVTKAGRIDRTAAGGAHANGPADSDADRSPSSRVKRLAWSGERRTRQAKATRFQGERRYQ